jgi:hypothetical protein
MGLQELEGFESPFVDDFAGAVSPFRLLSQAAGSRPAIASTAGLTARIVFRVRHGDLPIQKLRASSLPPNRALPVYPRLVVDGRMRGPPGWKCGEPRGAKERAGTTPPAALVPTHTRDQVSSF